VLDQNTLPDVADATYVNEKASCNISSGPSRAKATRRSRMGKLCYDSVGIQRIREFCITIDGSGNQAADAPRQLSSLLYRFRPRCSFTPGPAWCDLNLEPRLPQRNPRSFTGEVHNFQTTPSLAQRLLLPSSTKMIGSWKSV
jgi:hypothetical protein